LCRNSFCGLTTKDWLASRGYFHPLEPANAA